MSTTLNSLRRRVSAVLAIALAVSVAANVAAAESTVVGRAVAAWPPLALLCTVEVVVRAPRADGLLGRLSTAATFLVAGVAAVASFTHMRSVALQAGESELVAVLFPLTVDGLAVVCSVSLVEIARRLRSVGVVEVLPDVEPVADQVVSGDAGGGGGLGLSAASTGVASSVVGVPVGAAVDRQPVVLLTRNGSSPS